MNMANVNSDIWRAPRRRILVVEVVRRMPHDGTLGSSISLLELITDEKHANNVSLEGKFGAPGRI